MLTYKSSYKWTGGIVLGEVLDFPGTIAYGHSLDEARANLASALRDMAETNLLKGEPLPIPDPTASVRLTRIPPTENVSRFLATARFQTFLSVQFADNWKYRSRETYRR